jgi:hypothetical protein
MVTQLRFSGRRQSGYQAQDYLARKGTMPESNGDWDFEDFAPSPPPSPPPRLAPPIDLARDVVPRPTSPSMVERRGSYLPVLLQAPQHLSSEAVRIFKVGEVHPSEGIVIPVMGHVTVFSDQSMQVKVTVNWPEKDVIIRNTAYKSWDQFKKEDPIYAMAMEGAEDDEATGPIHISLVRIKRGKWEAVRV